MIGEVYGKFTIIEEGISHKNRYLVRVRCQCGYEGLRRYQHLQIGRTAMCVSCKRKEVSKVFPPPVNRKPTVGQISTRFYTSMRFGAKRRGLSFELTKEFLWELFLSQDSRCAITGRAINLSLATKAGNTNKEGCRVDYEKFNASLDRIDSSKGYTEGNVWWVHKDINFFKNNYSMDELYFLCEEVLNGRKELKKGGL
jgi:hypothetical protein